MEHLIAAREQWSDLFDGKINFQIQIDLKVVDAKGGRVTARSDNDAGKSSIGTAPSGQTRSKRPRSSGCCSAPKARRSRP